MTLAEERRKWFAILSRGILFLLIWWILTDGSVPSLWIGVPAVFLAVTASMKLIPPVPFDGFELFRFVPFFLLHSLLGGVDVARRAFQPDLPIAPELIEYPMRLPPGLPLVFMTNVISLLPGTLSVAIDRSVLKLHVLDGSKDYVTELKALEQGVARLFRVSL